MPANPYAPPHQEYASDRSWLSILLFLGISAGTCGLCYVFMEMTVAFAMAALAVVAYFFIGRIWDHLIGFAKFTTVELVVVLAILGVLWGLLLPGVSSVGRRRNRPVPIESTAGTEGVFEDVSGETTLR